MAKYEVWGRREIAKGQRTRLAIGFSTEMEARAARAELIALGFKDTVIVQRPPRYGRIAGLQKQGAVKQKRVT